jgi:SecD/SecF fusion protein
MRRSFLRPFLICLIPTLLGCLFVGIAINKEAAGSVGFRRGIDLAGGTILVYEVDQDRFKDKNNARELTPDDIKQLAEKLKRRIDPADLKNVVVRPVGNSRVEIILPYSGSTSGGKESANEEFVQEVRNLVKQAGVMEFRILANVSDDREGITEAQKVIDEGDPKTLSDAAKAGKAPPAPEGKFKVKASGDEADVSYQWVELGQEERESLGLSQAYEKVPPQGKMGKGATWMYPELEARRGKTVLQNRAGGEKGQQVSYLLYSRNFEREAPTKDEQGNEKDHLLPKKVEYFVLTRVSNADNVKIAGDVRIRGYLTEDGKNGNPAVGFSFNPEGAKIFGAMTERNKPIDGLLRSLAIIMDDKIVSAPTLNAILREGGQISGSGFDVVSVNRLVAIIRSGNLNAELKPDPVSENTVGATLGETTIRKGLWSVAGSFIVVLAFMVYYYRFAGIVACVALFANLLLTIGFMVAVQAAFTLPGLAGLVLMLGMAVDANVLIYERLREEREKGATLIAAIRNGYDRALPTIIDTHLTSIFTAIVLYTFGNDNLKGFSVALTVGLLISLFTSLFMTRLMFDYWISKRVVTQLTMHKLFARPKFDFMRIRKQMMILTVFLTVAGLVLFLMRGEKVLNVDFTQGTAYGGRLKEGQERALGTKDGKLGLVDLLGEDRQKTQLAVKEVQPLNVATEEGSGAKTSSENIYKIVYADGTEAILTLANKPEGATEAEQLANLKARASHMPDASVETVSLSGDNFGSKTRSFTIRTTEKESELVQVTLDRLLRDEKTNDPLLASTKIETDLSTVNGPTIELKFDKPTSPGYLKRFLERELKLQNRVPASGTADDIVSVKGVKSSDPKIASEEARTERYTIIRVDVSKNVEFTNFRQGEKAKPEDVKKDAEAFQKVLVAAQKSFELRPLPDRLETFDPALAKDTQNKAFFAVLISWIAVLAYLWFRFGSWHFGLAAVLCLIHDLCFTLGAIAVCHYVHDTYLGHLFGLHDFKIDLAAVAALLTLVGYSVNEIIVNFARLREVRGKNPLLSPQMINDSVNQTLSRTILTSMTVFLVSIVLFSFGGEGVHLFAFVMVTGVLISTYSSIYIASPLLLYFGEGKPKPGQVVDDKPTARELSATQASAATS